MYPAPLAGIDKRIPGRHGGGFRVARDLPDAWRGGSIAATGLPPAGPVMTGRGVSGPGPRPGVRGR